jgi:hypothetical protein
VDLTAEHWQRLTLHPAISSVAVTRLLSQSYEVVECISKRVFCDQQGLRQRRYFFMQRTHGAYPSRIASRAVIVCNLDLS